jgi:chromosome segregation ATPase
MMENVELKGKMAELQQKLSTPVPRKEQLHSGAPSKKEQELSALLEQVNRQLETAERARRQLTMEVEHLTAQRMRLERDMAVQKRELEEQKAELKKSQKEKEELEQKITVLMEQVRERERERASERERERARERQSLCLHVWQKLR